MAAIQKIPGFRDDLGRVGGELLRFVQLFGLAVVVGAGLTCGFFVGIGIVNFVR